jgi:hypothetical protein
MAPHMHGQDGPQSRKEHVMPVGGVGSIAAFQSPVTPQAKPVDDQAEPAATKAREAVASKDAPVASAPPSDRIVDIKV